MKTKIKSPNVSQKRTRRVSQNNSQSNYARRTKQILRGVIAAFGIFCVLATKAQSIDDTQTASQETVPTIVSTSSDRGDMRTRSDMALPSMRYHLQIDVSKTSATLEPVDVRSVELDGPNQVGVNRSVS